MIVFSFIMICCDLLSLVALCYDFVFIFFILICCDLFQFVVRAGRGMITFSPGKLDMRKAPPAAYHKMLCYVLQEVRHASKLPYGVVRGSHIILQYVAPNRNTKVVC